MKSAKVFLESVLLSIGDLWGKQPCVSSAIASKIFKKENFKNVLLQGIRYGRNAVPFLRMESGLQ